MIRRGVATSLVVASVVAGCAQLAGLGDPATIAAVACGIETGGGTCSQCVAGQCCGAAQACAGVPDCAMYESCLIPCGGDYACRSRCLLAHPPSSPKAADLDQCVASHCNDACGIQCGMTAAYALPDAADACYQCLATWACPAAEACFDDPVCSEVSQCTATRSTIDQVFACDNGAGNGGALFVDYLIAAEPHCLKVCGIGSDWRCVGNVAPVVFTQPTVATVDMSTDQPSARPLQGVSVQACQAGLLTCSNPLAAGVTDRNGAVALTLPSDGVFGFDGYFEMSAPGYVTMLQFLEFPLSVDAFTFGDTLLTNDEMAYAYASAHVQPDPSTRGDLDIFTSDCHWTPSPGVSVEVESPTLDGTTVRVYPGGTETATGVLGEAQFFNVPAGPVTLRVTAPGQGVVADNVPIFVRAGARSLLSIHPK